MSVVAAPDFWTSIFRGWRGRCPRCGAGSLFSSFLKMQSTCPSSVLNEHVDIPLELLVLVVVGVNVEQRAIHGVTVSDGSRQGGSLCFFLRGLCFFGSR